MIKIYDVIIVGAGPTGMYASYLSSLHKLDFLLLESNQDNGGQLSLFLDKPVYDLPGLLNITGKSIYENMNKQLSLKENNSIMYNQKVIKIKGVLGDYKVLTEDNEFKTKTVIIATGGGNFEPVPLGVNNEHKFKNIYYKVEDSKNFFGKDVVIFGGGDSAVDWSHYFQEKGSNVSLIHRRETFRGQDSLLEKIKNKVEIITPFKIKNLVGDSNAKKIIIENVKTKKIREISCDVILCFFGQRKISGKNEVFDLKADNNGFFVNSRMETSKKGIFAIGNISNYQGKVKMMITGFGEAATAIGSVVEITRPGKKLSYYVKKKGN